MEQIKLTPEEMAEIAPKVARLEGLAAGYTAGIEEAKRLIVKDFIDKKKVNNGTITQQGHAAAGHAANSANEPISQIQPTGSAAEPERPNLASTAVECDGGTNGFPAPLFPISSTTEPWLQRAFDGDDGTSGEPV
jgi:hypothetical protein